MQFEFNEQQTLFRDAVRDFAAKEIAPIARECDERGDFPLDLFQKLGSLGYLGQIRIATEDPGRPRQQRHHGRRVAYATLGIFLGLRASI